MAYTMDDIKAVLGSKFKPDREYVLETNWGATNKLALGWLPVGSVNDATSNSDGKMTIMESPKSTESSKNPLRKVFNA